MSIVVYRKLIKTVSLDNVIREFSLAQPSWVMTQYNPSNLFARMRLGQTRHVTEYSPAKTGEYPRLLLLPTQMRFLIGGERVTCRGLNLSNSLGRIKLINSLGKQQLELWTRT